MSKTKHVFAREDHLGFIYALLIELYNNLKFLSFLHEVFFKPISLAVAFLD